MSAINEVKELLRQPKKIVITNHYNPDGDAMGSSLGLYHFLCKQGHDVCVITPNEYAHYLHFLPGNATVVAHTQQPDVSARRIAEADVFFMLDYNDLDRSAGY